MTLENPFLKARLPLVEGEVEVGRLLHDGDGAGDGRAGIDEVGGVQRCAAGFALVAIGALGTAVRTFARHVAVGKELSGLRVVELLRRLLDEFSLVVETAEKVGRRAAVSIARGAPVDVERDAEILERIADQRVITVNDILRGHALAPCLDRNGHSVFVAASYHHHLFSLEPKISYIDVGRYIYSGQMPDVYGAVRIRQCRRHKCPFEFAHLYILFEFTKLLHFCKIHNNPASEQMMPMF